MRNAVLVISYLHLLRADGMAESLPGPSVEKKRRTSGGTRWTLPDKITSSAKSNKFAYCKLCPSITHCGINDIKHHSEGKGHSEQLESQ